MAVVQVVDAIANEIPRRFVKAHLDHLGVPDRLRPVLPMIKIATAVGLLAGVRSPRIAAVTSASLVAYYAAAVRFHQLSGDHPIMCAPAAVLAFGAALNGNDALQRLASGKTQH